MSKGIIIAIEGIDGSGKTTIAKNLKRELENKGLNVVLLKEPTDSIIGKEIRKILATNPNPDQRKMMELYAKDRKINVEKNIEPALRENKIVILDRYVISSLAYQSTNGIPYEEILQENSFAPIPDMVIILDLPEEIAVQRLVASGKNVDSFEKREFLKKVRGRYKDLSKKLKTFKGWEKTKIYLIDATKSVEEITKNVLENVLDLLKERKII